MSFSFSRCVDWLPRAVSELHLAHTMEEGKPRAHRRAFLLLCVYIAVSAEGSENLGTLEYPALRLPPAQWAARATVSL